MIDTIERMLSDLEHGKLTRRQFAVSLASLAAGAFGAPAALAAPPQQTGFHAVSVNHVTVRVPDLHRTSRFYQEFFGMPLKQQSAKMCIRDRRSKHWHRSHPGREGPAGERSGRQRRNFHFS